MFIYDPCLLITTIKTAFSVVKIQIDNTLILRLKEFNTIEEEELTKAKFSAKPKELFSSETLLIFNGCILTQKEKDIKLRQKE
jgi:hypothetical protein